MAVAIDTGSSIASSIARRRASRLGLGVVTDRRSIGSWEEEDAAMVLLDVVEVERVELVAPLRGNARRVEASHGTSIYTRRLVLIL
jgi:hypothetical protein